MISFIYTAHPSPTDLILHFFFQHIQNFIPCCSRTYIQHWDDFSSNFCSVYVISACNWKRKLSACIFVYRKKEKKFLQLETLNVLGLPYLNIDNYFVHAIKNIHLLFLKLFIAHAAYKWIFSFTLKKSTVMVIRHESVDFQFFLKPLNEEKKSMSVLFSHQLKLEKSFGIISLKSSPYVSNKDSHYPHVL